MQVTIQIFISQKPKRRFYFFGRKVFKSKIIINYVSLNVTEKWHFTSDTVRGCKLKMIKKIPKIIYGRFPEPRNVVRQLYTQIINYKSK